MTADSPQAYEDLLSAFAARVGLDPRAFLKTQELVIEGLHIGLTYAGQGGAGDLLYFANLGAPAAGREAVVYKALLQANHMWAGTGGATLGVQMDTGNVVLAGQLDFRELGPEGLAGLLDAFAETAIFWRRFVAGEAELDPPPPYHTDLKA